MIARKICECGCGEEIEPKPHHVYRTPRFKLGHHARTPIGSRYAVDEATGCWNWTGTTRPDGYGIVSDRGPAKTRGPGVRAHRWMYEKYKGPIPDGLQIDHLCFNPTCVNPDHLEAVTPAVNTQRCRSTKLTEDDVREIRNTPGDVPATTIAAKLGVDHRYVRRIRRGFGWENVSC